MSTHVDTGTSTPDAAKSAAADTAATAADQAKAVASTASAQAHDVAGEARAQVANVADEAKVQAQRVVSTATSEISSQLEQRLTDAAQAARTTAEELRALAEGRPEEAGRTGDLAKQASQRLERVADRVDELGVQGVAEEVTDFARRRPVAFLVGAAAAGMVVGRLARAGKEVQSSSTGSPSQVAGAGGVQPSVAGFPSDPLLPSSTATMPGQLAPPPDPGTPTMPGTGYSGAMR